MIIVEDYTYTTSISKTEDINLGSVNQDDEPKTAEVIDKPDEPVLPKGRTKTAIGEQKENKTVAESAANIVSPSSPTLISSTTISNNPPTTTTTTKPPDDDPIIVEVDDHEYDGGVLHEENGENFQANGNANSSTPSKIIRSFSAVTL